MTASKVTATGRDRHITDPWAVLILLVLVSLLLGGCGDDQSQVQTEPDGTTQARTEPVLAAQIQYDLVGTRWVVVDMAGFPDDNVVDGRFSFGNDWFGYHDGVNDAKSEIRWNESGFTVTVTGASTDNLGPPGEERYLNTLVETGAHVEVVQRADGSLTLAQGELMVTAEPFQKENDLVDTEWAVVEMAGFPNNNAADATFQFGSEWFGFYDGVNWGSHQIIWNESGFTGGAPGDMTDMGPPPGDERYLNTLVETGAHVEVVRRADGSLTLTRGETDGHRGADRPSRWHRCPGRQHEYEYWRRGTGALSTSRLRQNRRNRTERKRTMSASSLRQNITHSITESLRKKPSEGFAASTN